jgi:hypothetical protein
MRAMTTKPTTRMTRAAIPSGDAAAATMIFSHASEAYSGIKTCRQSSTVLVLRPGKWFSGIPARALPLNGRSPVVDVFLHPLPASVLATA